MADVPLVKSPVPLAELAGADTATDGQVPTSDGAGAVAWETPAGGASGVFLTSADTGLTWHESGGTSVAANSYHTILDLGAVDIVAGVLIGVATGFRLTIDSVVVANRTVGISGLDSRGDLVAVVAVPPARASTSMKLEVYNNSGAARNYSWRVVTR